MERTEGYPGRVAFGDTSFITAPKIREDEAMYLYYEGLFCKFLKYLTYL